MKKHLQYLSVIAGAGLLAACGGSDAPPPAADDAATTAAPAETAAAEAPAPTADSTDTIDGTTLASFTADEANGEQVFAQCMTCHSVQEGKNNVGPSLYQVVGRHTGKIEAFKYSDANKNKDIVWTEENLFVYLEKPTDFIPGTIMAFPGLRNPQDRADVIAYLKNPA